MKTSSRKKRILTHLEHLFAADITTIPAGLLLTVLSRAREAGQRIICTKIRAFSLLFLLLTFTLSGVQIPIDSNFSLNPSGTVTARVQDDKLHITIGKTAEKITYASLLLKFKIPQDWSDFRDVRLSIRSNQKILVKCSFGDFKKYARMNWPRQLADETEREFLFERRTFIFPADQKDVLSSVKQFTIGL